MKGRGENGARGQEEEENIGFPHPKIRPEK